MKVIPICTSKNYDVIIEAGILDEAGSFIRQAAGGQTAVIITDNIVNTLYGKRLAGSLGKNGFRTLSYIFPNGEISKNLDTYISIVNFLAKNKLSRSDVVVALGGGVTGDLAGFAAASYMRGTRLVQIPTTLLAAVDSSVGGKTGVNLEEGKNLLGTFYQPDLVLCDTFLLSTAKTEVYRDGCAEVIKYGVIADRDLFDSLKTPVEEQAVNVISRCVEIKRDIVAEDEFDKSTRMLLNFGHTVGHAIELLSGYTVSHGHAVAAGMVAEARIAACLGLCGRDCIDDISDMLRLYDLPCSTSFNAAEIAKACLSDKKRDGDSLTVILPKEIGRCILKKIPGRELEDIIRAGFEYGC